ncbi:MAG: hypothetical protein ACHQ53_11980 [Polyangiales bacterium]
MTRALAADVPTLTISDADEQVIALLRELQRAVLLHPEAARALFRALAREGRAFAQTVEGARWKERIASSELVARALLVMQTATLFALEEETAGATPSALVDAIASAAATPGRDALVERLLRGLDGGAEHD